MVLAAMSENAYGFMRSSLECDMYFSKIGQDLEKRSKFFVSCKTRAQLYATL